MKEGGDCPPKMKQQQTTKKTKTKQHKNKEKDQKSKDGWTDRWTNGQTCIKKRLDAVLTEC